MHHWASRALGWWPSLKGLESNDWLEGPCCAADAAGISVDTDFSWAHLVLVTVSISLVHAWVSQLMVLGKVQSGLASR